MHLPPLAEKRGTYGIFPPVGGANPYTIMTYRGDYLSSRQLAGAAMFMMLQADIPRERVPDTRYDPPIYGNGVLNAGIILHDDYLKEHARDRQERISYLINALDRLRGQYFQWTLAAEFEANVQDAIRNGAPPTGVQLSKAYLALLRQYYGHDRGVAAVDEVFGLEWVTSEVSFYSYEHLFWPPAMAVACLLVERLRDGDPQARRGIHELLGRGDSDLSYDLLREVGIDMSSREPYQALVRRMNTLMDELDKLLAQKERIASP